MQYVLQKLIKGNSNAIQTASSHNCKRESVRGVHLLIYVFIYLYSSSVLEKGGETTKAVTLEEAVIETQLISSFESGFCFDLVENDPLA